MGENRQGEVGEVGTLQGLVEERNIGIAGAMVLEVRCPNLS